MCCGVTVSMMCPATKTLSYSYLKREIYPVESTRNITTVVSTYQADTRHTCNNIVMSRLLATGDSASSTGFEDKYRMPVPKAHTQTPFLRWRRGLDGQVVMFLLQRVSKKYCSC
jgi:hypothetical protein